MNEAVAQPENTQPAAASPQFATSVKAVYILYLVGLVIGITGLIGVIVAYVSRGDNVSEAENTHYQFQIRSFWIGFLYLVIGAITAPLIIGYFVLLWWLIWLVVRCVKGLSAAGRGEAIKEPTSWGFGG